LKISAGSLYSTTFSKNKDQNIPINIEPLICLANMFLGYGKLGLASVPYIIYVFVVVFKIEYISSYGYKSKSLNV